MSFDFPVVLPLRQRLGARFTIKGQSLFVATTRTMLRVRLEPALGQKVFRGLKPGDRVPEKIVSVRRVGQTDDLSALWDLSISKLDSGWRTPREVVLELGHGQYQIDLGKPLEATNEYALYRAFLEGARLGLKIKLGDDPQSFGYAELLPYLIEAK